MMKHNILIEVWQKGRVIGFLPFYLLSVVLWAAAA